jgi:hypothetical protein
MMGAVEGGLQVRTVFKCDLLWGSGHSVYLNTHILPPRRVMANVLSDVNGHGISLYLTRKIYPQELSATKREAISIIEIERT